MLIFASAVGVPIGIIKYVAIWEQEGQWNEIKLVIGQLNTLILCCGIIMMMINIYYSNEISYFLFGENSYYFLVVLISLSIPFALLTPVYESILKGLKKYTQYVKLSLIITVASLLLTIVLVYFYSIEGAVISLVISSALGLILYIIYFHKSNLLNVADLVSFNFRYSYRFKKILKLGIASLLVGSVDQISQLLVRSEIIRSLGIESNGIYQSIYAISLNYFSILFMSLGVYLLPILSQAKEKHYTNSEINSTLKLTFIFIVPLITSLFIFREYLIIALYSKEFLPATELLFLNFLGDYFKAFSWILGIWLIPLSRVKEWSIISLIYYFNFVVIFYILIHFFNLGLKSVVISYLISYVIHSGVNLYYIVKYNEFTFTKRNLFIIPLSFVFVLFLMFVSNYNVNLGYLLILPFILLWFSIVVTRNEFLKSVEVVKSKLSKYF